MSESLEELAARAELVTAIRVGALRYPDGGRFVLMALRTANGKVQTFKVEEEGAGALESKLSEVRRTFARLVIPPPGWRPNGSGPG